MDIRNFIKNIRNQSRENTCSVLTEFVNILDFRNSEHRFLYEQAMARVFRENMVGFSKSFQNQTLEFARVRKCCCKGSLFNNLCELIYPPDNNAKIGRANLEGEAVFYCSNYPGTSIFEVRPKLGDWIATTTFKNNRSDMKSIVIGADVNSLEIYSELPSYIQGIHDFLKEIFIEEIESGNEHNYYKTASICKSFIGNTNSIMYPSVASNLKGWNYVFSTSEFISNFEFVESRIQEITEYRSPSEFKVKCVYIANSLDNFFDLKWERHLPECEGHNIDSMIYD